MRAEAETPRFVLQRGQALLIDNWRMLHAREKFSGLTQRVVHRVWWWSDEANEAMLELASKLSSDAREKEKAAA